jgi:rhomboid family GlyGly-CTERM serine protease
MKPMDFSSLIYHRQAFLEGQWWLPVTGQLAHLSTPHAIVNFASAGLLWAVFRPWLRWQQQFAALGGGFFVVALVVILDVHCDYYAGASGALHGWAAGGAVYLLTRVRGQNNTAPLLISVTLLLGLLVKLLWQAPDASELSTWGFPVYTPSHWGGALGGIAFALLTSAARFARRKADKNA